jgi:cytochrome c556
MLYRKSDSRAAGAAAGRPAAALDAEQAEKAAETRQAVLKVDRLEHHAAGRDGARPDPLGPAAVRPQRAAHRVDDHHDPGRFSRGYARPRAQTEALPVIWEDFARFEELAGNARRSARAAGQRWRPQATRMPPARRRQLTDDCKA